jgi:hypothetical protein
VFDEFMENNSADTNTSPSSWFAFDCNLCYTW